MSVASFTSSSLPQRGFHLAQRRLSQCSRFRRPVAMAASGVRPRVCIVGGGFGGLYTAVKLMSYRWTRLTRPEIVLVSPSDRFCFLPMMYELLNGDVDHWQIAPTLREILDLARTEAPNQLVCPTTTLLKGTMQGLDVENMSISVTTGPKEHVELSYDHLVLALGNEPVSDIVPGAREHAFRFQTLADAERLLAKLDSLENTTPRSTPLKVFVIGGGSSGVELSCALSERLSSRAATVELVDRGNKLLRSSAAFNRKTSVAALRDLGVKTTLSTGVDRVTSDSIVTRKVGSNEMQELKAALVVWTTGSRPNSLLERVGLPRDSSGRLMVSDELAVKDTKNIFAVGDIAKVVDGGGQTSAATAQHAFQQTECLSRNIRADILGGRREQYRYQHLGEMLVLGRDKGSLSGLGLELDGKAAFLARRAVYLARMPTVRHASKVGASWAIQPAADIVLSDDFVL